MTLWLSITSTPLPLLMLCIWLLESLLLVDLHFRFFPIKSRKLNHYKEIEKLVKKLFLSVVCSILYGAWHYMLQQISNKIKKKSLYSVHVFSIRTCSTNANTQYFLVALVLYVGILWTALALSASTSYYLITSFSSGSYKITARITDTKKIISIHKVHLLRVFDVRCSTPLSPPLPLLSLLFKFSL